METTPHTVLIRRRIIASLGDFMWTPAGETVFRAVERLSNIHLATQEDAFEEHARACEEALQ